MAAGAEGGDISLAADLTISENKSLFAYQDTSIAAVKRLDYMQ